MRRWRAAAGVLAPVAFVTSWVVAGALRDGYDPLHDAISRLAELGAPRRWIVTAGMVVFGLGALAFAPLLRSRATLALSAAGLASFAVAGLPCTEGCPGSGAVSDQLHGWAAALFYVAFALTPALHSKRGIALALASGMALGLHGTGVGPNGALQRAGLTLLDAWMALTALRAFSESREMVT